MWSENVASEVNHQTVKAEMKFKSSQSEIKVIAPVYEYVKVMAMKMQRTSLIRSKALARDSGVLNTWSIYKCSHSLSCLQRTMDALYSFSMTSSNLCEKNDLEHFYLKYLGIRSSPAPVCLQF